MDKLYTFKEICQIFKVSPNTVKTWKRRGHMPAKLFFKIGGTLYVFKEDFDKWLKEKQACEGDYYGSL